MEEFDQIAVKSIVEDGYDDVYDISNYDECRDGEGNFLLNDVLVHNCIPEYVKRRDDASKSWVESIHPDMRQILEDTYGTIVYQEQLSAIWMRMANFTAPEAEAARKAVAKKRQRELKNMREKWNKGSAAKFEKFGDPYLTGYQKAEKYWDDVISPFARYAFNKCLASGTILVDCVTGQARKIEDAKGMILRSSRGYDVVADVHFNGYEPVYKVTFSNGIVENVTIGHKYLTDNGFKTVGQLSTETHLIKYIGEKVSDCVQKIDNRRRVKSCTTVCSGQNISGDNNRSDMQIHVTSNNMPNSQEAWRDERVHNKSQEFSETQLLRCFDAGGVLLVGDVNGRWVCEREEELPTTTVTDGRHRHYSTVYAVFQSGGKDSYDTPAQRICGITIHGQIDDIQQEIGCQIDRVWGCSSENRSREVCGCSASVGLHKGIYRWGWDNYNKWERLPNGWIRCEFRVWVEIERNNIIFCAGFEPKQNGQMLSDGEFIQDVLDGIYPMQENIELDTHQQDAQLSQEVSCGGIYIKSVEYIGVQPVYSPEMASIQHNYSIGPDHPIAANSHSCSYITEAYWCLWLKAHYPEEWWASIMSYCDRDKLVGYMDAARADGVKFGTMDINQLSTFFTVDPVEKLVTPGLLSIKGIGAVASTKFTQNIKVCNSLDEFVSHYGRDKRVMERLILLGAFRKYHPNIKATLMWYRYKYGSEKKIKDEVNAKILLATGWTSEKIAAERQRQMEAFRIANPRKSVIPVKISKYMGPKPEATHTMLCDLYEDFSLRELLDFELEYLGYYWHSPMDLYKTSGGRKIKDVKKAGGGVVEGYTKEFKITKTKTNKLMGRIRLYDGKQTCTVFVWEDELKRSKDLKQDIGIMLRVEFDKDRGTFAAARGSIAMPLELKDNDAK